MKSSLPRSFRPMLDVLELRACASVSPAFTVSKGHDSAPAVAVAGNGVSVIAWSEASGGHTSQIRAQLYAGDGHKLGGVIKVTAAPHDRAVAPAVAMDARGNFAVVWQADEISGIEARLFWASGKPRTASFRVAQGYTYMDPAGLGGQVFYLKPSVVMTPDGRFAVGLFDGDSWWDIGRSYTAAGKPSSGLVTNRYGGFQFERAESALTAVSGVALTPGAGFDLLFAPPPRNQGLGVQQYTKAGQAVSAVIVPGPMAPDESYANPLLAGDERGNGVVVYQLLQTPQVSDSTSGTVLGTFSVAFGPHGITGAPAELLSGAASDLTLTGLALDPRSHQYVVAGVNAQGHCELLEVAASGAVQATVDLGVGQSPAIGLAKRGVCLVAFTTSTGIQAVRIAT